MPIANSEETVDATRLAIDPLLDDAVAAFEVFARHRSFTTAAVELAISQPALHTKIKKLQTSLGVSLYETTPNRTIDDLTAEGKALEAYAKDARRLALDRVGVIRGGHRGPLVIAAGRGGFLYVIADAVKELSSAPEGLKVLAANNDQTIAYVRDGSADVGLIGGIPAPDDLSSAEVDVFGYSLVVSNGHRLATRNLVKIKDLDGIGLALPEATLDLRRSVVEAFQVNAVSCTIEAEALDWDLLVQFVEFGIEATIVNDFFPAPAGLTKIPIADLGSVSYTAIWRGERDGQAARFLKATGQSDVASLIGVG